MLQPKLFQAYTKLGMDDHLSKLTYNADDGCFDQLTLVMSVETGVRAKREEAMQYLEKIKPGSGMGNAICGTVRELVTQGKTGQAILLITQIQSSDDISYACDSLGAALYANSEPAMIEAMLPKLASDAGRTHCASELLTQYRRSNSLLLHRNHFVVDPLWEFVATKKHDRQRVQDLVERSGEI